MRLGTQLCDEAGALVNREFSRAGLPHTVGPGESAEFGVRLPAPGASGRYALKFDLVCEGVGWFEKCGSETTMVSLTVE